MEDFKYKYFIAGSTRNRENILKVCNIFEDLDIPHYCFLKNKESHIEAGLDVNDENLADTFESLPLNSEQVKIIFRNDLEGEKASESFLLVLPAGKSVNFPKE